MTAAVMTEGLGRRYGRRWALANCTIELPAGRVAGLVGPNGAGKTTLLHLLAGLLRPSAGSVTVLGCRPGSRQVLSRLGFVAQDKPLYRGFTVEQTLAMGGWLNPGFDHDLAGRRLAQSGIPRRQPVGTLSSGQQAQVALALALGKRPELLVLDEPVNGLDPLARREFLAALMEEVAESGCTVLLSSHLIADLEQTCDYLLLMSASRVRLDGDTTDLRAAHLMVSGPRARAEQIQAAHTVVRADYSGRHASLLIRAHGRIADPAWSARPATLEELVVGYMSAPDTAFPSQPRAVAGTRGALA